MNTIPLRTLVCVAVIFVTMISHHVLSAIFLAIVSYGHSKFFVDYSSNYSLVFGIKLLSSKYIGAGHAVIMTGHAVITTALPCFF